MLTEREKKKDEVLASQRGGDGERARRKRRGEKNATELDLCFPRSPSLLRGYHLATFRSAHVLKIIEIVRYSRPMPEAADFLGESL